MFVRYVFGNDRKRAHAYTYVIKAAISYDVSAENLPAYITNEGGIEEIKRSQVKSPTALAKQVKLNAAKAEVKLEVEMASAMTPLATVAIAELTGTYALMLVKQGVGQGWNLHTCHSDKKINCPLSGETLSKLS